MLYYVLIYNKKNGFCYFFKEQEAYWLNPSIKDSYIDI